MKKHQNSYFIQKSENKFTFGPSLLVLHLAPILFHRVEMNSNEDSFYLGDVTDRYIPQQICSKEKVYFERLRCLFYLFVYLIFVALFFIKNSI